MAIDANPNIEHYPTAGLKHDPNFNKLFFGEARANDTKIMRERQKLRKYEIKNPETLELVNLVKSDLVGLYEKAGINISDRDFPPIFLLPENVKPLLNPDLGKENTGYYFGEAAAPVIFISNDPRQTFIDLWTMHHELHHSLGKGFVITNEKLQSEIALSGLSSKNSKGDLLEEGIMEYFAYNFLMTSENPIVVKAKSTFAGYLAEKLKLQNIDDYQKQHGVTKPEQVWLIITNTYNGIMEHVYKRASGIIEDMISISEAKEKSTNDHKMIRLLLQSRRSANAKRQLYDYLEEIFDRNLARTVMRANLDSNLLGLISIRLNLKADKYSQRFG